MSGRSHVYGDTFRDRDGVMRPLLIEGSNGVTLRYCMRGGECSHPDGPYLPIELFQNKANGHQGKQPWCRACMSAYGSERALNKRRVLIHDVREPAGRHSKRKEFHPRQLPDGTWVKTCTADNDCVNPLQPNIPLNEENFTRRTGGPMGFDYRCRLCMNEYQRKNYRKNRENIKSGRSRTHRQPLPAQEPQRAHVEPIQVPDNFEIATTGALPEHDFYSRRSGTFWLLSTASDHIGISERTLHQRYMDDVIAYENQLVVNEPLFRRMWTEELRDQVYRKQLAERAEKERQEEEHRKNREALNKDLNGDQDTLIYRFNVAKSGLLRIYRAMMAGSIVFRDDKTPAQLVEDIKLSGAMDVESETKNGEHRV